VLDERFVEGAEKSCSVEEYDGAVVRLRCSMLDERFVEDAEKRCSVEEYNGVDLRVQRWILE
jgi:hypothetical protein